jgi:hypothetical protein
LGAEPIYNEARIIEGAEGIAQLQLDVATKISNPKRRQLLVNLAIEQVASLEQLVRDMEHEEVERLSRNYEAPLHGKNGK